MDGVAYRLDYGVIIEMAKALKVEINQIFFEKVKAFENEVLRIWKGKKKKDGPCDEEQKAKCQFEFGEFFEWACKNCEVKNAGK